VGSSIASHPPGLPARVILLLSTAVFVNYVDRGNLATASPLLKDELGLSNSQIGLLLSAFFWSYAPLQPVAGWLAQRFDVRHVLAIGLVIWSAATTLVGLVSTFASLFALRILLGLGESVAYPCIAKLIAQRAPEHERGRANGLIAAGQALGPTFGTLGGGLVMAQYGWRAGFIAFGLVSFLWLLPWLVVTRGGSVTAGVASGMGPLPYGELLKRRALWGASIGAFCSFYSYYFLLTWLPLFLVKAHGFNVKDMAKIGAGVYAVHAASSAVIGWASDRWILAGTSPDRVRKALLVGGLAGTAILMLLCSNAGSTQIIWLLAATGLLFGTQTPNIYSLAQTLGGPRAAGQWMGVQNLIGNLAGVVAPVVTGAVLDRLGSYFWAFAISAVVALAGCLAFGVVIPRIEALDWPQHPAEPVAASA
jgi:MFS family permease